MASYGPSAKTYYELKELVLTDLSTYLKLSNELTRFDLTKNTYDTKEILLPFTVRYTLNREYLYNEENMMRFISVLSKISQMLSKNPIDNTKLALQLKLIIDNLNTQKILDTVSSKVFKSSLLNNIQNIQTSLNAFSIAQPTVDVENLRASDPNEEKELLLSNPNTASEMIDAMKKTLTSISDDLTTNMIIALHNDMLSEKEAAYRTAHTHTGFEHVSLAKNHSCKMAEDKYAEVRLAPPSPSDSIVAIRYFNETTSRKLRVEMINIVSEYHKNLSKAENVTQRLDAILRLVKELTQCHPFKDGNTRTFTYGVLNRELIKNGFKASFLKEPHLFKSLIDTNSLAQTVVEDALSNRDAISARPKALLLSTPPKLLPRPQVAAVPPKLLPRPQVAASIPPKLLPRPHVAASISPKPLPRLG